jgi:HK97 family phage prohead protease
MKVMERRYFRGAELRVGEEGGTRFIHGYAAVFDAKSQPLGGFREIISKGAFKKTLRDGDVVALMNHDPNLLLGRKSARTLSVWEDEKGLAYKITPPDTTYGRDLIVSIDRGDLRHSSFAFRVYPGKERWSHPAGEDLPVRELLQVELFDVSPVTNPAYHQTEVHVRAVMDAVQNRLHAGDTAREERDAMALALDNLRSLLLEPGEPHLGMQADQGTGEPRPDEERQIDEWREELRKRRLWCLEIERNLRRETT